MKANQKFLNGDDEAVSPVIAVILMVAITVVLAATVYVWVSGFGAQSSNPAKTLSLTSNGAIASSGTEKYYTIASATPGMKWSDLEFTLDGTELLYDGDAFAAGDFCVADGGSTCATGTSTPTTTVDAGDMLKIKQTSISGKTLRVLDANANSVILTLTVG